VKAIPRALTIAGSDSGGCAGIQADLKTFGALGVHGMTVITSVTAQNTERILMATDLPLENIRRQIEAVADDIDIDAVKTGMLSSSEIIEVVAECVRRYSLKPLVIDPVMVSTGGSPLIAPQAIGTLRKRLFPLATAVTPNLREAEILTNRKLATYPQIKEAAREVFEWGPDSVIITGGHSDDSAFSTDCFYDGKHFVALPGERIATANTHGSGCTFAAAIAAFLARGAELEDAVSAAKRYVTEAIRSSFPIGKGPGPLGHFFAHWDVLKVD